MATALSIDLDFFNVDYKCKNLQNTMERIVKLKVPLLVVNSHEKMTGFINRFKFNTLINMDEHSDMVEKHCDKKHCGSWVNFVNHDNQKRNYVWLVSQWKLASDKGVQCSHDTGRCDITEGFYTEKMSKLRPWHNARVTTAQSVIRWHEIVCVGIALSTEYTLSNVLEAFLSYWWSKLLAKGLRVNPDVPVEKLLAEYGVPNETIPNHHANRRRCLCGHPG